MPNDDERCEVARRLRYWTDNANNPIRDIPGARTILRIEAGAKTWRDAYLYLADLIEPSCDRDALLSLADEMDRDGKMQRERQKAGEHWFIDGLDVREYARRIREALGVEK